MHTRTPTHTLTHTYTHIHTHTQRVTKWKQQEVMWRRHQARGVFQGRQPCMNRMKAMRCVWECMCVCLRACVWIVFKFRLSKCGSCGAPCTGFALFIKRPAAKMQTYTCICMCVCVCRVGQNWIHKPYICWFSQRKYRIYAVYIWFWPTLLCMCSETQGFPGFCVPLRRVISSSIPRTRSAHSFQHVPTN